LHPSGVAYSSTSFGWGNGGNVTSAGWQVMLCDPIWHVSSRSGVASRELLYSVYFTLLFLLLRRQVSLHDVAKLEAVTYSRCPVRRTCRRSRCRSRSTTTRRCTDRWHTRTEPTCTPSCLNHTQQSHHPAGRHSEYRRLPAARGSVAEWLACWTQAQNGLGSNRSRDVVG